MTLMGAGSQDLNLEEYRELAEFRHQIRCFQSETEKHARTVGFDAESYLLLLTVQGLPEGTLPTLSRIAERMRLDREIVSDLVDAAVLRNLVIRSTGEVAGGGEDWVKLTRVGRESLRRMAVANRAALEHSGADLVHSLQSVLKQRRRRRRVA